MSCESSALERYQLVVQPKKDEKHPENRGTYMYGSILTGKVVKGSNDANRCRGIDIFDEVAPSELACDFMHKVALQTGVKSTPKSLLSGPPFFRWRSLFT
jgi:hypothetical protein